MYEDLTITFFLIKKIKEKKLMKQRETIYT